MDVVRIFIPIVSTSNQGWGKAIVTKHLVSPLLSLVMTVLKSSKFNRQKEQAGSLSWSGVRQVGKWTWQRRTFSMMEQSTGRQEKQLESQRNQAVIQTWQLDWQARVHKDTQAFVHRQLSILWSVMALNFSFFFEDNKVSPVQDPT